MMPDALEWFVEDLLLTPILCLDEYIQVDIGQMSEVVGNWTYEYNVHTSYLNIGYDLQ